MNKYLCLIILLLIMIHHYKLSSSEHGLLVKKISRECSNEISKKYKLQGGLVGGSFAYDVREVAIDFWYSGGATIPQARRLFVEAAEIFIKKFNANKEIRPYLRDYPFNLKHLGLAIFFTSEQYYKDGKISFINALEPDIAYYGRTQNNKTQEIFRESYAEALKIVREEKAQQAIKGQKS